MNKIAKSVIVLFAMTLQISALCAQSGGGESTELWAKSIIGQKAPELRVDAWVNRQPDASEIKGKCMLIHFWSPMYAWGAYITIPRFNRLSKELADDLVIIGVTDADAESVADIAPTIEYPYASAPAMVEEMKITGFCYAIFVAPDGVVRWEGCPYLKGQYLSDKELKHLIKQYKHR